jgi:hypothetical protein
LGFAGVAYGLWRSRRHRDREWTREQRQRVYADWAKIYHDLSWLLGVRFRAALDREDEDQLTTYKDEMERLTDRAVYIYGEILLVGSQNVLTAADEAFQAMRHCFDLVHAREHGYDLESRELGAPTEALSETIADFVHAARTELVIERRPHLLTRLRRGRNLHSVKLGGGDDVHAPQSYRQHPPHA